VLRQDSLRKYDSKHVITERQRSTESTPSPADVDVAFIPWNYTSRRNFVQIYVPFLVGIKQLLCHKILPELNSLKRNGYVCTIW
jgi:hypothetical protein